MALFIHSMLTLEEQKILDSIVVTSENDPHKPEFPADSPKFPATTTRQIKVPGFSNVWLKDESENPTGTHKDRMAWEIVVTYRELLRSKKSGQLPGPLPHMSIISSGSAATAIQTQLKKYNLPNLKVIVDVSIDPKIKASLERIGCEVYEADLSRKALKPEEILAISHNPDGFDITSDESLNPTTRFYDWMSYEIINNSPEWCFLPFGTGHLYENILNINKKEVATLFFHDPRFSGNSNVLRKCNFIGATTNNPKSKADKLYSPHLPFVHFDEQWIRLYRGRFCGEASNVYPLKEEFLDKALEIAKEQNIICEPSGIAGLGMLLQMADQVPPDAKILIVNTGKTKI